jgi:hypothetical protein
LLAVNDRSLWHHGHEMAKSQDILFALMACETIFIWKIKPIWATMILNVGLVSVCNSSNKVNLVQTVVSRDPEGFGDMNQVYALQKNVPNSNLLIRGDRFDPIFGNSFRTLSYRKEPDISE